MAREKGERRKEKGDNDKKPLVELHETLCASC
jgi:hypothetical protein